MSDGHHACAGCTSLDPSQLHRVGACAGSILLCQECDDEQRQHDEAEAGRLRAKASGLEREAADLRRRAHLLDPGAGTFVAQPENGPSA